MRDPSDHDWDEDEVWLEGRRSRRGAEYRAPAKEQVGALAEDELPGSIYFVRHAVWKFPTRQPKDRPGVCVACEVPARWAWLCRGIDAASPVLRTHDAVLVPPSAPNGLEKLTAFLVEPCGVRLHRLLTLHDSPRRIGRLEDEYLRPLRQSFLDIHPGQPPWCPMSRFSDFVRRYADRADVSSADFDACLDGLARSIRSRLGRLTWDRALDLSEGPTDPVLDALEYAIGHPVYENLAAALLILADARSGPDPA